MGKSMDEELLKKCLKDAFHELQEETKDEQVCRVLGPVLEKLKDGELNRMVHEVKRA